MNIFVSTLIATVVSSATYNPSSYSGTTLSSINNGSSVKTKHVLVLKKFQDDNGVEVQHILDLALEGNDELPQDHHNSPQSLLTTSSTAGARRSNRYSRSSLLKALERHSSLFVTSSTSRTTIFSILQGKTPCHPTRQPQLYVPPVHLPLP